MLSLTFEVTNDVSLYLQHCAELLPLQPGTSLWEIFQEMPVLSEVLDAPYNQVEPTRTKIAQTPRHKPTQPQSKAAQERWFWVRGCLSSEGGAELCCGVSACTGGLWRLSPAPWAGAIRGILDFSDASFDLP